MKNITNTKKGMVVIMVNVIQGKYEEAKEYYEKSVKSDYFEFSFAHASYPNEMFREIDRFIWESKHEMTRYRNSYEGPVLIDITSWNNNELNTYFDAFMYYLKDNGFYECTFIVQERCSKEMQDRLEFFFEVSYIMLNSMPRPIKRTIGFAEMNQEADNVRI